MKFAAAALRVAAEIGGVFLILAATADVFDATEVVAFVGIAALLVTVETVVAFSRVSNGSRRGSSNVAVLALLAVIALSFVRDPRRYTPSHVALANVSTLFVIYG